ncbi:MAG: amidohydrolase family protein [Acidobacteria bacterium]|nr:amidohydrolase family protein [Acidobacteriota bacterium]
MRNAKRAVFLALLGMGSLCGPLQAQQDSETLYVNGKIVTLADKSFTSSLGTIAQAMLVRNDKIAAVGSDAAVRRQASPGARVVDLKGRAVLPGLISVHEHPFDWTPVNPYVIKKILTDDLVVTRVLEGSPEEQLKAYPATLQEALGKAKPGQWIYMVFTLGKNYEHSTGGNGGFGQASVSLFGQAGSATAPMITKAQLDTMAPNNPVMLRDVFVQFVLNSRGLEEADKVFPKDVAGQINHENGIGSANPMRWMFSDVIMRDKYPQLKELQRLGLSWWSGYGMTAFASQAYDPANIRIFTELSRSGQMPIRNMWAWNWRENFFNNDEYWVNALLFMEGLGNEFFWNGGARGAETVGRGCSTLEARVKLAETQTNCAYAPGSKNYQTLYQFIKMGGRYALTHTQGDKDVDYILDIIEKASKDAGFTPEQIRAKRHTFDHTVMAPRPDQLKRIKDLGVVLGGDAFEIYQASPGILKAYGEKALEWVVPKKSLIDAQIPSGFEVDRALEGTHLTIFWTMARMIDRKSFDGKVYAPSQKISRELALKTTTTWGASYLMKEDLLGSLEPGKWADFIVVDRDYLTVPESEIQDTRVLMTVVGGKVVHLVPSLAKEIGMKPTGAQVELGGAASRW